MTGPEATKNVSIPSNGSIQFLPNKLADIKSASDLMSQSPQTGQFNSYKMCYNRLGGLLDLGLNPLKRVNSILTVDKSIESMMRTVVVSIPSNGSIQFLLNLTGVDRIT